MEQPRGPLSRRTFLKGSGVAAGELGIYALAPGLTNLVEAAGHGVSRVTETYEPSNISHLSQLVEGTPIDFSYPMTEHPSFLVKLGVPAVDGVGSHGDVVAFSYLCAHMGCPLNGRYREDHKVLGPCVCHYTTFDLSKNGIVALGQATQSLPQVILEVRGNEIWATGVTGLVYGFQNNLGPTEGT